MIFRKLISFYILIAGIVLVRSQNYSAKVTVDHDLQILVDETLLVDLVLSGNLQENIVINFYEDHKGYIQIVPNSIEVEAVNGTWNKSISVTGLKPGHFEVVGNSTPAGNIEDSNLFMRVIVANSRSLILISSIVGWMYFVAWSISFYPQAIMNFKKKSVVGLNFDFLALNLLGHSLYCLYNTCLYFIPYIENEYFERYPRGLNPVELNDIFFSVHATILTAFTCLQCFFYERGGQRVSIIASAILGIFFTILVTTLVLASIGTFHWLDFLNGCSYIKLAITLIKYVPQAVMNYRRKSTSGWSIGNILLDFTGGMLSMLQMMLNSYNYDDWQSIFGDPTKFGLGLFSVLFDILFIVQHYYLYRKPKSTEDSSDVIKQ